MISNLLVEIPSIATGTVTPLTFRRFSDISFIARASRRKSNSYDIWRASSFTGLDRSNLNSVRWRRAVRKRKLLRSFDMRRSPPGSWIFTATSALVVRRRPQWTCAMEAEPRVVSRLREENKEDEDEFSLASSASMAWRASSAGIAGMLS